MALFMLSLSGLLVVAGMLLLPPLTGSGLDGLVSRLWLVLGVLVFAGHYLNYLQAEEKARLRKQAQELTGVHRFPQVRSHKLKQKSISGQ